MASMSDGEGEAFAKTGVGEGDVGEGVKSDS